MTAAHPAHRWWTVVIGLPLVLAACADIAPLDPQASPGAEGASCDIEACGEGLSCVAGTCVRPCLDPVDCQGRSCLPLPGGSSGWCAPSGMGQGPAEPQPDAPQADPPGSDRPAPGAQDDSAPLAGGSPEDLPPKVPDEGAPAPDAEQPAPAPERTPDPAPEPPAEAPPPAPCRYPAGPHALSNGAVVPDLSWNGAFDAQGRQVDFSFRDFHCDPAYDRYSILAVVVGAEWCGACSQYLADNRGGMTAAEAAGALYLFVEVQDMNYNPASNAVARRVIERHAPGAPGLRVGDGATWPAGAVGNAPIVQQYPTMFAVRRSDMRLIPSLGGYIDFASIARQEAQRAPAPDAGQPGPAPDPGPAPAPGGCDEEPLEPNDSAGIAPTLTSGEQVVGGVCNGSDDFFRIEHDGFWTVNVRFEHGVGDLDVYLWDENRGAPAIGLDGRPVASASGSDDEQLVFLDPQVIQVTGYQGARAPYVLTVIGH